MSSRVKHLLVGLILLILAPLGILLYIDSSTNVEWKRRIIIMIMSMIIWVVVASLYLIYECKDCYNRDMAYLTKCHGI